MKKTYFAVRKVREFIAEQPFETQAEYVKIVERLEADGHLVEPFGKKLERDLFEMRLRRGRQVRVVYVYCAGDRVIGVHAFVKKTQQTPGHELKYARKIAAAILRGDYEDE